LELLPTICRLLTVSAAVLIVATTVPVARASERVTLRNGFEMRCDHHALVDGKMRLYLNQAENSYIEFKAAEIAAFEPLPDASQATVRPQANSKSDSRKSSKPSVATNVDARLSAADLHEMLTKAGKVHDLDVDLLTSLVHAESGGNTHAVSRAGARGLTQLMPATASSLNVKDSFNPEENLRGGSTYLDSLLVRYHENLALALAAYNAGPAAVDRYGGIPPFHETRAYVARVIHEFNRRVRLRETETPRNHASISK
jgi:soluble lytic murein transglycosylase-like protein